MLAGEVANGVTHQVPLVVALVTEHLVARLAVEFHIRLLLFHLQARRTIHHRAVAQFTATFVLLHVLPQIHVRSEDPAALGAGVLPLALVLDLVIVQQRL